MSLGYIDEEGSTDKRRVGSFVFGPDPGFAAKATIEKLYEVRVRCSINRLIELNIQSQTFTAEFRLEASWLSKEGPGLWEDPSPNIDTEKTNWRKGRLYIEGCDQAFFTPQIYFKNITEEKYWEDWGQVYGDPKNKHAVICYRLNAIGVFQEIMELQYFPVDTQELTMKLSSFYQAPIKSTDLQQTQDLRGRDLIRVNLIENCSPKYRSFCDVKNFVLQHEYELLPNLFFKEGKSDSASSASHRSYPELSISAVVTRRLGYWWWNVIVPIFLISSTTCAAFAVPAEDVADRCSVSLTILLTTVAYKYVVVEKLPEISYLTVVDRYIMAMLGIQITLTLFFTFTGAVAINAGKAPHWELSRFPLTSASIFMGILTFTHTLLYRWLHDKMFSIQNSYTDDNSVYFYVRMFKPEYCTGGGASCEGEERLIDDFCKMVDYLKKIQGIYAGIDVKKLTKDWNLTLRHWTWLEAEQVYKSHQVEYGEDLTSSSKVDFCVLKLQTKGTDRQTDQGDFFFFVDCLTKFEECNRDVETGQGVEKPALTVFKPNIAIKVEKLREDWKVFVMDMSHERSTNISEDSIVNFRKKKHISSHSRQNSSLDGGKVMPM